MSEYINLCVDKRKNAANINRKNFYKLMINAVYGKTMKNVSKHRDIKLVNSDERRKKLVREPNYRVCKVFDDNFMAIEMRKTEVIMNKPIYLGQAILDISKKIMYDYWYSYLKPKYNDKITQTPLLLILKLMIFTRTYQMMWKKGLILLDTIKD